MSLTSMNGPEDVFFVLDGKEYCNEELALSILLKENILFCNGRQYVEKGLTKEESEVMPETVVLFVNCNDLFWWATGDAEPLPCAEIGPLFKAWRADPKWGVEKWCCRRRNLAPQQPIVERMKKDGAWDAEMDALPKPQES